MNNGNSGLSLFEKMLASSANTGKDKAVFHFLRELETIDREWGEHYDALRKAKEQVKQDIRRDPLPAVKEAIEVLYEIFDQDSISQSLKDYVKSALSKGRALIDAVV